ncbi:MAG: thermonuclease family protein [Actinomycetota bacterium]
MRRALVLCVAATLLAACTSNTSSPSASSVVTAGAVGDSNAEVVRVVDGDTIVARFGSTDERVRFLGMNTPETVKPNSPVDCFGPEASAYTKSLLPKGTKILVVRDIEPRDDYGRLLGYIYRSSDGLFVNVDLVAKGYATLLTHPPNVAHVDELKAAQRAARAAKVGLWKACAG